MPALGGSLPRDGLKTLGIQVEQQARCRLVRARGGTLHLKGNLKQKESHPFRRIWKVRHSILPGTSLMLAGEVTASIDVLSKLRLSLPAGNAGVIGVGRPAPMFLIQIKTGSRLLITTRPARATSGGFTYQKAHGNPAQMEEAA